METGTLCVYVDESGNFGDVRDSSRYCMVTLVFQGETAKNTALDREYDAAVFRLGADPESMVFHSAPLIRQEDQFSAMSRNMRGRLFYQMLSYVRKGNLRFRCFSVDTRFVDSKEQVVEAMKNEIGGFIVAHHELFGSITALHLYYDAGQKEVTHILEAIPANLSCSVECKQGVRQAHCRMLQVADFICTVQLIGLRLREGLPFNNSEQKFFGSPRSFERNILRKIKTKEIA